EESRPEYFLFTLQIENLGVAIMHMYKLGLSLYRCCYVVYVTPKTHASHALLFHMLNCALSLASLLFYLINEINANFLIMFSMIRHIMLLDLLKYIIGDLEIH
ncbi:hypothetical protein ACJX0J_039986, partial [Zea mays]